MQFLLAVYLRRRDSPIILSNGLSENTPDKFLDYLHTECGGGGGKESDEIVCRSGGRFERRGNAWRSGSVRSAFCTYIKWGASLLGGIYVYELVYNSSRSLGSVWGFAETNTQINGPLQIWNI